MKITIRQPLSFSEIGGKDNQEDRIYPLAAEVKPQNRVFVLCDGMGGHDNGEVASETVSQALGSYLDAHQPQAGAFMLEYFNEALSHAYDELDKKDTDAVRKMGTTMTCLCLYDKGYLVAHIGDSRIYHIRPAQTDIANRRLGIIYQSSDHSLVNDLLRMGELTEDEAVNFPQKNVITRAMQPHLERRHKADIYTFNDIQAGDYFFLCCDGVLEQLTNERLCEILADKTLDDAGKLAAIKQVCDENTKDNYTAFLIPVDRVETEASDGVPAANDAIQALEIETVQVEEDITDAPQAVSSAVVSAPLPHAAPVSKKCQSLKAGKRSVLYAVLVLLILLVGFIAWLFLDKDNEDGTDRVKELKERIELVKPD